MKKGVIYYLPILGIIVFLILFYYSTTLYPGGSQVNMSSPGFSWIHNYWCNLTDKIAMNGVINPARAFAIPAMIILCGSLLIFFNLFAVIFAGSVLKKRVIQYSGFLAMIFTSLIFTSWHNLMILFACAAGSIVTITIIMEGWKNGPWFYKITGSICTVLLILNTLIYYTGQYLIILPFLQKITFLLILIWISGMNIRMIQINNI